jgi:multiple sugar transport system permease protein
MNKKTSPITTAVVYLILILFSAAFLIPFVYMISIALSSDATANQAAYTIFPKEFEVRNFIRIFTESNVPIWLKNSLILTVTNTVFTLVSSSMVAYGFARFRVKGKSVIFMILLSTMMIPTQVTLIPQFMIFRRFGWINTMLPLIIPNLFGSPFYIFMLRQFIMRLPISLDEAAKIDGMSYWGIYYRIVLPLIKPALAAVAIFAIMGNWNWFFEPMIYLNQTEKYPLAIGVQILSAVGHAGQLPLWNLMMAAAMILVIPMILLFFLGQKQMFELSISTGSDSIK